MSETIYYKTITISTGAFEAIEVALNHEINSARENIKVWEGIANNEPCLTWAKERLESVLAAKTELVYASKYESKGGAA